MCGFIGLVLVLYLFKASYASKELCMFCIHAVAAGGPLLVPVPPSACAIAMGSSTAGLGLELEETPP
jgi:hypothetical protein